MKTIDRFVLSGGDPAPAAFLVDHLYVAHGLRERLAWRLHRATRGRALATRTTRDDLPVVPAGAASWLVETDYAGSARNRSIVFVFAERSRCPALVVKRMRVRAAGGRSLARERETLEILRHALPDRLAWTVPQVVSHETAAEWETLTLTWLPGRSAYVEMQTRLAPATAAAAHFGSAAAWLARFHEATALDGRVVEPPPFAHGVDPVQAVRSHGDFWARNVLLVRDVGVHVTGVVDWEQSCGVGSPFDDLFHFALTYGVSYPWARYRRTDLLEALRRTFVDDNRVSRAVRAYFRSYCRDRGIAPGVLEPWFRGFLRGEIPQRIRKGDVWIRFDEMLGSAGRSVFSG